MSARTLPVRHSLRVLLAVVITGCAAKPPETPIVLRPHHLARHYGLRPTPSHTGSASESAATETGTLSEAEKERLFQDFDAFRTRSATVP